MTTEVYIAKTDGQQEKKWMHYKVPYQSSDRVAQVLQYIYEHIDGSIGFRQCFCKRGTCGLCMMRVNGKNVKTCHTAVVPIMYIEPLSLPLVRDLVVSFHDVKKTHESEYAKNNTLHIFQ